MPANCGYSGTHYQVLGGLARLPQAPKGGMNTEQLNIEGKRSGEGFVAHKAKLVNALSRALAERVLLVDMTLGRKGFLGYLKAMGGSNIVKIVPSSGSASGVRAIDKRLRVVCGANTSYLEDSAWIGDKTPLTICEVRVSPSNTVKPNLGATELSEALSRVLPFTAKEDNRPVLQCVLFRVKDGKLWLVSADGYRLATLQLDCDGDEGEALVTRNDLRGVTNALKRAKRVRLSFENKGESLESVRLVLDTEAIRYSWQSVNGTFPEYEKLIPTDFKTTVSFDSNEALKAVSSLKVLYDSKSYPVDLTIGNGKLIMSIPDDKGQAEIPADIYGELAESTQGEGKVRLDGGYLMEGLRACDGMVELRLVDAKSPVLFAVDGYQLVTMPMYTPDKPNTGEPETADAGQGEAGGASESATDVVAEAEAIAEAKSAEAGKPIEITEKPKKKRKVREPVAV